MVAQPASQTPQARAPQAPQAARVGYGTKRPATEEALATCSCNKCGKPALLRISRSDKNPNRKFWACSDKVCGAWIAWADMAPAGGKAASGAAAAGAAAAGVAAAGVAPGVALGGVITRESVAAALAVDVHSALAIRANTQGSTAWLAARALRITASQFGSALGLNPYESADAFLASKLWGDAPRPAGVLAMAWGSGMEATAIAKYVERMFTRHTLNAKAVLQRRRGHPCPTFKCSVHGTGLWVSQEHPFLAGSPDGIVDLVTSAGGEGKILLEIKCPTGSTPYSAQPKYASSPRPDIPAGIPPQYYAQIQGCMAICGLRRAHFCVLTVGEVSREAASEYNGDMTSCARVLAEEVPASLEITEYAFDEAFWKEFMLPGLTAFYWDRFVPAFAAQKAGRLRRGEIKEVLEL